MNMHGNHARATTAFFAGSCSGAFWGPVHAVCAAAVIMLAAGASFAQDSTGGIAVTVTDYYTGAPLPNARILVTPGRYAAVSAADGTAAIFGITPYRNYQVDAEVEGYRAAASGFVGVQAGATSSVMLPLKKAAVVTGRVTTPFLFGLLRRPVRRASVLMGHFEEDYQGEYFVPDKSAKVDFSGSYRLDNVEEGDYHLIVLAAGFVRSDYIELTAGAGQTSTVDVSLTLHPGGSRAVPDITLINSDFEPVGPRTVNGRVLGFDAALSRNVAEYFWMKERVPEGDLPPGDEYYLGTPTGKIYAFTVPAVGDYTVRLFAVDAAGVVASTTADFTAENVAPTAVPSVIPGPSELPYLNAESLFATSSGAAATGPGETVFLRGFAVDENLLPPDSFNPDAPHFDAYGNKNGNFRASIFSYSWSLGDSAGEDLSSLLQPAPTAENVSFVIPADAQPGDVFTARLTVSDELGLAGAPAAIDIHVADPVEDAACAQCHPDTAEGFAQTTHAQVEGGAGCQDCHGPGSEHVRGFGSPKLSINNWNGVCGQCHTQFAELQKANHSDPLPFGYYEPSEGRSKTCYKCHYTAGYIGAIESDKDFHKFTYGDDVLGDIPMDSPNVSCSVCHDPHQAVAYRALRAGSPGHACDTCHYEKWHNAVLEGLAGMFENGYHYPGEDYSAFAGENNPHRTEDKCVLCHMSTQEQATDDQGIRALGGHTLRMRDFGADGIRGTDDDLLNLAVCRDCHEDITGFDRNGVQTAVGELLTTLGGLLAGRNHDFLPANQPGSCARCHKGGTVAFLDDPEGALENAYTNYKLIINDRSMGIHNPGYVSKLLQDSIDSLNRAARGK